MGVEDVGYQIFEVALVSVESRGSRECVVGLGVMQVGLVLHADIVGGRDGKKWYHAHYCTE